MTIFGTLGYLSLPLLAWLSVKLTVAVLRADELRAEAEDARENTVTVAQPFGRFDPAELERLVGSAPKGWDGATLPGRECGR